jgi:hypothetical protein
MQILAEGQPIRHGIYGAGVVLESDSDRTTVDFDDHGTRKFVTSIWSAELTGDPPVKLVRRRARKPRKPASPKVLAVVGK